MSFHSVDVKSPKPENAPTEDSLPVLKLLRPEFRAQLTVASRKSKGSEPEERLIQNRTSNDNIQSEINNKVDCVDATVVSKASVQSISDVKDGHYYLERLAEQVKVLESLATSAEDELATCENEEGCGVLRAAAGKARLLVSQKLNQFQGLCHNNIKQSSTEDFPTTNEDLAGFWDMVMIQVKEVLSLFDEINELRNTNWKKPEIVGEKHTNGVSKGTAPLRKSLPKRSSTENKVSPSNKARDEARRKLIEEKRKAMKENKTNTSDTLFVV